MYNCTCVQVVYNCTCVQVVYMCSGVYMYSSCVHVLRCVQRYMCSSCVHVFKLCTCVEVCTTVRVFRCVHVFKLCTCVQVCTCVQFVYTCCSVIKLSQLKLSLKHLDFLQIHYYYYYRTRIGANSLFGLINKSIQENYA